MTHEENARWWKAATERAEKMRNGWRPPTSMTEAEFRTKRGIKANRLRPHFSRVYDARLVEGRWLVGYVAERDEFREIMTFASEDAARDLVKLLEKTRDEESTSMGG